MLQKQNYLQADMAQNWLGFSGIFYVEDGRQNDEDAKKFFLHEKGAYYEGRPGGNWVTNCIDFKSKMSIAAYNATPIRVRGLAEKLDSGSPAVSSPVKILFIEQV